MLIVMMSGCRQSAHQKNGQVASTPYRTDVQSIQRRLPKLVGITKCYWKGGQYGDGRGVPGPGLYWMKGFVFLTGDEAMRIGKSYQWHDTSANWKPELDMSVLGVTPSR